MKMHNAIFTVVLILLCSCNTSQENWSHYRGSNLNGHSESKSAPVNWSQTENIIWKTAIDGRAWSSPVIYGDQVWVSSASKDGKRMFAVCLDFESGQVIKEVELFNPEDPEHIHPTNSYATPTPCIEEGRAYFHFGTFGTACVDTKTQTLLWKRTDLNCHHMQGPASSPILYKNLLIVHLEGTDVQFIAALNKLTGETVWLTHRPSEKYEDEPPVSRKSYQTPLIITVNGQDQLVSNGSLFCIAYDPETGKEIWRIYYGEDSTVAMPLYFNETVYVNSGWVISESRPFFCRLYAVDPTGKGDVSDTHVKWMSQELIPQTSTPVIVDSLMYSVTERGTVSCRNAISGDIIWKEDLMGNFDASMIYAADHIYFSDTKGKTYVIQPGSEYSLLAVNDLGESIKATPAILRGSILLRTEKFLYRIEKTK